MQNNAIASEHHNEYDCEEYTAKLPAVALILHSSAVQLLGSTIRVGYVDTSGVFQAHHEGAVTLMSMESTRSAYSRPQPLCFPLRRPATQTHRWVFCSMRSSGMAVFSMLFEELHEIVSMRCVRTVGKNTPNAMYQAQPMHNIASSCSTTGAQEDLVYLHRAIFERWHSAWVLHPAQLQPFKARSGTAMYSKRV